MVYTLRFFSSKCSLFHKSKVFGSYIIHILYTGCVKIKKNNSGTKRLKCTTSLALLTVSCTHFFHRDSKSLHDFRKLIAFKRHTMWELRKGLIFESNCFSFLSCYVSSKRESVQSNGAVSQRTWFESNYELRTVELL